MSITPQHVGDLLVLGISGYPNVTIASVVSSGSGPTWHDAYTSAVDSNDIINGVYWAQAANTTAFNVTVTFNNPPATVSELTLDEFNTTLASPTWSVVHANGQLTTSNATVSYPSLATTAGELYYGYAVIGAGPSTPGTTTGFSWEETNTFDNMIAYDVNTSAPSEQPTFTQASAANANAVGVVFSA
jgi:hypothetical protein